jgi:branched-chain amino acid aminotransferase
MNLVLTDNGWKDESEYSVSFFQSEKTIYEVIRVIDGVALFLEYHFLRLQKSMRIQELELRMSLAEFKSHIEELCEKNHQLNGNIKFVYSFVRNEEYWAFSFIPHNYPTQADYENGVPSDFLFAERQNPNAKVVQQEIRDKANQMIADKGLYEVLLVDRDGKITEGSRSNVFFVKSGVFYTAPASMILEGITRQKVFDCLKELGFAVVEEAVLKDEIGSFDAAFITGTSPKVLPLGSAGTQIFDVRNDAVSRLIESYNQMIQDYIRSQKRGA